MKSVPMLVTGMCCMLKLCGEKSGGIRTNCRAVEGCRVARHVDMHVVAERALIKMKPTAKLVRGMCCILQLCSETSRGIRTNCQAAEGCRVARDAADMHVVAEGPLIKMKPTAKLVRGMCCMLVLCCENSRGIRTNCRAVEGCRVARDVEMHVVADGSLIKMKPTAKYVRGMCCMLKLCCEKSWGIRTNCRAAEGCRVARDADMHVVAGGPLIKMKPTAKLVKGMCCMLKLRCEKSRGIRTHCWAAEGFRVARTADMHVVADGSLIKMKSAPMLVTGMCCMLKLCG